jgi:hypothetical protein
MNEFKPGKNTLILSIMTLLTVLTWIAFEVYQVATKVTIPKVTQEQMKPLNPRIKKEILEGIKKNIWFSDEEMDNFSSFSVSTESAKEK